MNAVWVCLALFQAAGIHPAFGDYTLIKMEIAPNTLIRMEPVIPLMTALVVQQLYTRVCRKRWRPNRKRAACQIATHERSASAKHHQGVHVEIAQTHACPL